MPGIDDKILKNFYIIFETLAIRTFFETLAIRTWHLEAELQLWRNYAEELRALGKRACGLAIDAAELVDEADPEEGRDFRQIIASIQLQLE